MHNQFQVNIESNKIMINRNIEMDEAIREINERMRFEWGNTERSKTEMEDNDYENKTTTSKEYDSNHLYEGVQGN